MIVIDASVFAKLILDEPDSAVARTLVSGALETGEGLLAPTLLVQEALQIAIRWSVPTNDTLDLIDALRAGGFRMREPERAEYELACAIARSGDAKSGHPQFQASVYHAMAIENGGTLITADRRHAAKTASFGALKLLAD